MNELKIEWHTSGFVKDAKYEYPLRGILENYKNEFNGAETLIVDIEEEVGGVVNLSSRYDPVSISEDRKIISIKVKAHKFIDNKNKIIFDSPGEVFEKLRNTLNAAIDEYKVSDNK